MVFFCPPDECDLVLEVLFSDGFVDITSVVSVSEVVLKLLEIVFSGILPKYLLTYTAQSVQQNCYA